MEQSKTEYEIKARVDDNTLDRLLNGTRFLREIEISDQYLDTKDFELYQAGVFIRLRNEKTLQIKYNPNLSDFVHIACEEREMSWPVADEEKSKVNEFLAQFIPHLEPSHDRAILDHLFVSLVINKKRSVHIAPGLEICVDEVEGLGRYVEVEASTTEATQKVDELCREVGLRNLDVGYVELYLRKVKPTVYAKGRYILEEDRQPKK